jgi:hypothetical protein
LAKNRKKKYLKIKERNTMKQIFDETTFATLTLKNRFFRAAVGDRIKDKKLC